MAGKFEIRTTKNGQFGFNLKASNGQVILTGQTYADKRSATNGVDSVRRNCVEDKCFERKAASDGSPYFVLVSKANGQIIGRSETYSSNASMEKGIASVRKNAPDATLTDLTG